MKVDDRLRDVEGKIHLLLDVSVESRSSVWTALPERKWSSMSATVPGMLQSPPRVEDIERALIKALPDNEWKMGGCVQIRS
jgi:hypothetical protein